MKKLFSISLVLMAGLQAGAQYYYLDIIGTAQTNKQYKLIKENRLQKISAASFEGNNQPSADFVLEQTVGNNGQQITTRSASVNSGESYFISSYENDRLAKTVDSSNSAINTVLYVYDAGGKLVSTIAASKDFDGTSISAETHNWKYNSNGQPESMLKVKNGRDSTYISYKLDEAGNVVEENWKKNNRTIETYYYYYNARKQLTDIVRFNRKAKQMLPDFMFEYDTAGLLSQMTQTQGTSANYLIWRYIYNTNGLKEKEIVFNKQKELLGKIEYTYQ
jgi:hypothetical protein